MNYFFNKYSDIEALELYTNSLARIAQELIKNGSSLDDAIQKAPEEYYRQESEFSKLLLNPSFKADCVKILRSNNL